MRANIAASAMLSSCSAVFASSGNVARPMLVADVVPELVVDRLEPVDVQIERGHPAALTAGAIDRAAQPVLEVQAVGEAGEIVVHRLVGDLLQEATVLQEPLSSIAMHGSSAEADRS